MLCSVCRQVDLADLLDEDNVGQDIIHQPSIPSLQSAAHEGCDLCQLLWNGLVKHLQKHRQLGSDFTSATVNQDTRIKIRGVFSDPDEPSQGQVLTHLRVRCEAFKANHIGVYSIVRDPMKSSTQVGTYGTIIGRRIGSSEDTMRTVRQWVNTCSDTHSGCIRPKPPSLPTRVIDVGRGDDVSPRLHVSTGEHANYVSLIHCWGKDLEIVPRTTLQNLVSHTRSIHVETLPKTFRDAIRITRQLGIRYIWIAALCIVQDDPNDQMRESAVFGDTIHNAYLSIAATAAHDPRGGCFVQRDPEPHVPVAFSEVDKLSGCRIRAETNVRPKVKDFDDLKYSALYARAWPHQELLLARRIVHFGEDQAIWQCENHRVAENGVPDHFYLSWRFRRQMSFIAETANPQYPDITNAFNWIWQWYQIVESHSSKKLMNGADRLVALSALAGVVQRRTSQQYVAGLWRHHIAIGLLWRGSLGWLTPPDHGYRAPSWSWASLDGSVFMPGWSLEAEHNVTISNIEATITQPVDDPTGPIRSGYLTLSGLIKRADARLSDDHIVEPSGFVNSYEWLRDGGRRIGKSYYDQAFTDTSAQVFCLQVACHKDQIQGWHGLLLEQTEKQNEFRRLGYFKGDVYLLGHMNSAVGWFDDAAFTELTIV